MFSPRVVFSPLLFSSSGQNWHSQVHLFSSFINQNSLQHWKADLFLVLQRRDHLMCLSLLVTWSLPTLYQLCWPPTLLSAFLHAKCQNQEKLLLPFLSFCLQHSWLKAAKQIKSIANYAEAAAVMQHCAGHADPGCAVLVMWPFPVWAGHSWPRLLLLALVLVAWLLLAQVYPPGLRGPAGSAGKRPSPTRTGPSAGCEEIVWARPSLTFSKAVSQESFSWTCLSFKWVSWRCI